MGAGSRKGTEAPEHRGREGRASAFLVRDHDWRIGARGVQTSAGGDA
jgi:hypothetical protein